jgi:hypothetical protein
MVVALRQRSGNSGWIDNLLMFSVEVVGAQRRGRSLDRTAFLTAACAEPSSDPARAGLST